MHFRNIIDMYLFLLAIGEALCIGVISYIICLWLNDKQVNNHRKGWKK